MSGIYFRGDEVFFESEYQSSNQNEEELSKVNQLNEQPKQQDQVNNNRPEIQSENLDQLEKQEGGHGFDGKPVLFEAIRTAHKNKIINKIRGIAPEIQLVSLSKNSNCVEQKDFIDKRERNKYSAKQSRDRKKLYIEIMEEKQKKLRQELASKKKELEETKNYLQKVINQNQTMSSFTTGRYQMIKRLEQLLEKVDEENVDRQINEVLDALRYRIGATGWERINTINEYFRQIINLSLPALHRYMMWSASKGNHLFGKDEEEDSWYYELKQTLNLSQQQHQEVKMNQQKFIEQKELLGKLIDRLKEIKNRIESKSIELEDMVDSIREILSPVQSAQFILFIERNKYRKELNICDIGEDQTIRKQVKKEQF